MPNDKQKQSSNQEDSGDNPWVNGRKKSVKEGHAENTSNEDSSDSNGGVTPVQCEMEMGEDEDSDEFDMGGFIRIRSQGDDIFEQDDDDEFDDDDFPIIPQVELRTPSARKRKQVINLRDNGDNEITEIIEIGDDTEHDNMSYGQQSFTIDPELYATRRRDRVPLYLLNPDDYAHDIKKQVQIRRAIITYRHHQDKKEQIIKLTDENQKLRSHIEVLRAKAQELANCGCTKNQNASLDELDIKIPAVPPRMYVRGTRSMLGVPYNKYPLTSTGVYKTPNQSVITGTDIKTYGSATVTSKANSVITPSVTKPLINIRSPRLIQVNSSTASGLHTNGSSALRPRAVAYTGSSPSGHPSLTTVKNEPGLSIQSNANTPNIIPSSTVKVEAGAAAAGGQLTKRLVTTTTTTSVPTASQLLFASKANLVSGALRPVKVEPGVPLTATRVPFANRVPGSASILGSLSSRIVQNNSGQVLKTASGQVLRLVQTPKVPASPAFTTTVPAYKRPISHYHQPILPKPVEETTPPKKACLDDMWKKYDEDDDEDEMAIIAAINGTPPPPRNRKQAIGNRQYSGEGSSRSGEEVEMHKYKDIVFEEAD